MCLARGRGRFGGGGTFGLVIAGDAFPGVLDDFVDFLNFALGFFGELVCSVAPRVDFGAQAFKPVLKIGSDHFDVGNGDSQAGFCLL